jgi:hypothetical protein
LEIVRLRMLDQAEGKARVCRVEYQIPVPVPRQEPLRRQILQFCRQTSFLIQRDGNGRQIDLKAGSDHLEIRDGNLRFRLIAGPSACVRPREMLQALGVADLENEGCYLTRTSVEIAA